MTLANIECDPRWLQALQARAQRAPRHPRVPLLLGAQTIGSVEPDYLDAVAGRSGAPGPDRLHRLPASAGGAWRITGDGTAVLRQLAQALHDADVPPVRQQWRGEQLGVCNASGVQLATVERGVVRPLGIATRAVHLVGFAPDGRVWVQQRALDKANDPGQWDTLMGGMIPAGDSLQAALERETWEEAGIVLAQLRQLRWRGRVAMQKPSGANDDAGYVVEQVDWYSCVLPDPLRPLNQDGEVAQFALLELGELRRRLHDDAFTTEAALILAHALGAL